MHFLGFRERNGIILCETGVTVSFPRTGRGGQHAFEAEIGEGIGRNIFADFFNAMGSPDQLFFAGRVDAVEARRNEEIRIWISLAPAWRIILTIFRLVVPRTMESSTTTTRFPSNTS